MKRKDIKGDVTTSSDLPAEMLAQVKKTSRRVGMNPSTFYRFAIFAMLKRFDDGAPMNARIQRIDGQVLGVGIFIDAAVVEQFTEGQMHSDRIPRGGYVEWDTMGDRGK